MNKTQQMISIRSKKLGLLILDARLSARRSVQECADAIGVSVDDFQGYEKGEKAPSLPELENLAYYLDISIDHFWGAESLSARRKPENVQQKEQLRNLRNRVIGASLRASRTKLNLSLQDLATKTAIPEDKLNQYESGVCPAPLSELEILSSALEIPVIDLIDQRGPVGKWRVEKIEVDHFLTLDPEVRQFVCKPVNLPYINLAKRLSLMSVEKLRAIAETILEITY
jgi:transcriptional regulator with XRE-family HTH domain